MMQRIRNIIWNWKKTKEKTGIQLGYHLDARELAVWCDENNITKYVSHPYVEEYDLEVCIETGRVRSRLVREWMYIFDYKEDAMLFKLTWA